MQTSFDKLKKADRNLKSAFVACVFTGLFLVGFALIVYLKHFLSKDWDKPVPANVYKLFIEGTRALVYMVLPGIGILFLVVGFLIWDYQRKRGAIKDCEKLPK